MKPEEEYKCYEIQHKQIRTAVERFRTSLNSLSGRDKIDCLTLQRRINEFDPLLDKFNTVQSLIEDLNEKNMTALLDKNLKTITMN